MNIDWLKIFERRIRNEQSDLRGVGNTFTHTCHTMPNDKMISPIIWRAMLTLKFGLDEYSAPIRIEKTIILGAP